MKRFPFTPALVFAALLLITACGPRPDYDVIIRGGTVPYQADFRY